jgi:hypothetical protein
MAWSERRRLAPRPVERKPWQAVAIALPEALIGYVVRDGRHRRSLEVKPQP